jgi:LPS O-antigen subunit length determinant protein (WzzB/FepE family)
VLLVLLVALFAALFALLVALLADEQGESAAHHAYF